MGEELCEHTVDEFIADENTCSAYAEATMNKLDWGAAYADTGRVSNALKMCRDFDPGTMNLLLESGRTDRSLMDRGACERYAKNAVCGGSGLPGEKTLPVAAPASAHKKVDPKVMKTCFCAVMHACNNVRG